MYQPVDISTEIAIYNNEIAICNTQIAICNNEIASYDNQIANIEKELSMMNDNERSNKRKRDMRGISVFQKYTKV